jgi:hypothetical protein
MNIIDELVTEATDVAEDKKVYKALKAEGIDPFRTKKVSDVCKASEISSLVLKELIDKVDGCDSSFARLVFLQTEEGLKYLQKNIEAKKSLNSGSCGFFRTDISLELCEPHEITLDEANAVDEFVYKFAEKIENELDTDYSKQLADRKIKAQEAVIGNNNGAFRRAVANFQEKLK